MTSNTNNLKYFLPSEIARLVLGYLKEENCLKTYKSFLKECSHLNELNMLLKQGFQSSHNIMGLSLTMMLNEYAQLKLEGMHAEKNPIAISALWRQMDTVLQALKKRTSVRQMTFAQGEDQTTRTRRLTRRAAGLPCHTPSNVSERGPTIVSTNLTLPSVVHANKSIPSASITDPSLIHIQSSDESDSNSVSHDMPSLSQNCTASLQSTVTKRPSFQGQVTVPEIVRISSSPVLLQPSAGEGTGAKEGIFYHGTLVTSTTLRPESNSNIAIGKGTLKTRNDCAKSLPDISNGCGQELSTITNSYGQELPSLAIRYGQKLPTNSNSCGQELPSLAIRCGQKLPTNSNSCGQELPRFSCGHEKMPSVRNSYDQVRMANGHTVKEILTTETENCLTTPSEMLSMRIDYTSKEQEKLIFVPKQVLAQEQTNKTVDQGETMPVEPVASRDRLMQTFLIPTMPSVPSLSVKQMTDVVHTSHTCNEGSSSSSFTSLHIDTYSPIKCHSESVAQANRQSVVEIMQRTMDAAILEARHEALNRDRIKDTLKTDEESSHSEDSLASEQTAVEARQQNESCDSHTILYQSSKAYNQELASALQSSPDQITNAHLLAQAVNNAGGIGRSPKRKKKVPKRRSDIERNLEGPGLVHSSNNKERADSHMLDRIINDTRFVETLAENINKTLCSDSHHHYQTHSKPLTADSVTVNQPLSNEDSMTAQRKSRENSLEEYLNVGHKNMSEDTICNIIDMTRNDPVFDSLFEIFSENKEEYIRREFGHECVEKSMSQSHFLEKKTGVEEHVCADKSMAGCKEKTRDKEEYIRHEFGHECVEKSMSQSHFLEKKTGVEEHVCADKLIAGCKEKTKDCIDSSNFSSPVKTQLNSVFSTPVKTLPVSTPIKSSPWHRHLKSPGASNRSESANEASALVHLKEVLLHSDHSASCLSVDSFSAGARKKFCEAVEMEKNPAKQAIEAVEIEENPAKQAIEDPVRSSIEEDLVEGCDVDSSANIFTALHENDEYKTDVSLPIFSKNIQQFLSRQIELGELEIPLDFSHSLPFTPQLKTEPSSLEVSEKRTLSLGGHHGRLSQGKDLAKLLNHCSPNSQTQLTQPLSIPTKLSAKPRKTLAKKKKLIVKLPLQKRPSQKARVKKTKKEEVDDFSIETESSSQHSDTDSDVPLINLVHRLKKSTEPLVSLEVQLKSPKVSICSKDTSSSEINCPGQKKVDGVESSATESIPCTSLMSSQQLSKRLAADKKSNLNLAKRNELHKSKISALSSVSEKKLKVSAIGIRKQRSSQQPHKSVLSNLNAEVTSGHTHVGRQSAGVLSNEKSSVGGNCDSTTNSVDIPNGSNSRNVLKDVHQRKYIIPQNLSKTIQEKTSSCGRSPKEHDSTRVNTVLQDVKSPEEKICTVGSTTSPGKIDNCCSSKTENHLQDARECLKSCTTVEKRDQGSVSVSETQSCSFTPVIQPAVVGIQKHGPIRRIKPITISRATKQFSALNSTTTGSRFHFHSMFDVGPIHSPASTFAPSPAPLLSPVPVSSPASVASSDLKNSMLNCPFPSTRHVSLSLPSPSQSTIVVSPARAHPSSRAQRQQTKHVPVSTALNHSSFSSSVRQGQHTIPVTNATTSLKESGFCVSPPQTLLARSSKTDRKNYAAHTKARPSKMFASVPKRTSTIPDKSLIVQESESCQKKNIFRKVKKPFSHSSRKRTRMPPNPVANSARMLKKIPTDKSDSILTKLSDCPGKCPSKSKVIHYADLDYTRTSSLAYVPKNISHLEDEAYTEQSSRKQATDNLYNYMETEAAVRALESIAAENNPFASDAYDQKRGQKQDEKILHVNSDSISSGLPDLAFCAFSQKPVDLVSPLVEGTSKQQSEQFAEKLLETVNVCVSSALLGDKGAEETGANNCETESVAKPSKPKVLSMPSLEDLTYQPASPEGTDDVETFKVLSIEDNTQAEPVINFVQGKELPILVNEPVPGESERICLSSENNIPSEQDYQISLPRLASSKTKMKKQSERDGGVNRSCTLSTSSVRCTVGSPLDQGLLNNKYIATPVGILSNVCTRDLNFGPVAGSRIVIPSVVQPSLHQQHQNMLTSNLINYPTTEHHITLMPCFSNYPTTAMVKGGKKRGCKKKVQSEDNTEHQKPMHVMGLKIPMTDVYEQLTQKGYKCLIPKPTLMHSAISSSAAFAHEGNTISVSTLLKMPIPPISSSPTIATKTNHEGNTVSISALPKMPIPSTLLISSTLPNFSALPVPSTSTISIRTNHEDNSISLSALPKMPITSTTTATRGSKTRSIPETPFSPTHITSKQTETKENGSNKQSGCINKKTLLTSSEPSSATSSDSSMFREVGVSYIRLPSDSLASEPQHTNQEIPVKVVKKNKLIYVIDNLWQGQKAVHVTPTAVSKISEPEKVYTFTAVMSPVMSPSSAVKVSTGAFEGSQSEHSNLTSIKPLDSVLSQEPHWAEPMSPAPHATSSVRLSSAGFTHLQPPGFLISAKTLNSSSVKNPAPERGLNKNINCTETNTTSASAVPRQRATASSSEISAILHDTITTPIVSTLQRLPTNQQPQNNSSFLSIYSAGSPSTVQAAETLASIATLGALSCDQVGRGQLGNEPTIPGQHAQQNKDEGESRKRKRTSATGKITPKYDLTKLRKLNVDKFLSKTVYKTNS